MKLFYKQYLKNLGIPTLEEFKSIVNNCPAIENNIDVEFIESSDIDCDKYKECLYKDLINSFLRPFNYEIDEINIHKKEIILYSYIEGNDLKSLNKIKEIFSLKGWTIY